MESTVLTISQLQEQLDRLRPLAGSPAEQVQLAFVEALLKRTQGKSGKVLHNLLEKATTALQRYEARPQQQSSAPPAPAANPLASLLEELEQQARHAALEPAQASLDELLAQIEPALVRPAVPTPVPAPAPVKKTRSRKKPAPVIPAGPELKATRKARKTRALDQARRLVDDMNALQPENPGPLNPQMLATRAISLMRDLSPAYLNRFLVLMDTLFWLEEGSGPDEPRKGRQA